MRGLVLLMSIMGVLAGVGSARAERMLFARYDWQNGAADVSGSPIRHDGVIDPGAAVVDGKLLADVWGGVELGYMPELDGATDILLRFEDVTFTQFGSEGSGATSNYTVLAGGGYNSWWVGVYFRLNDNQTILAFNPNGWYDPGAHQVVVADEIIDHFDSIEYRFDGAAAPQEQLAIRWNDGAWVTGGWEQGVLQTLPPHTSFRINDGSRADWDPMWATLGPVSFYSNRIPEPSSFALLGSAAVVLALCVWRTRRC